MNETLTVNPITNLATIRSSKYSPKKTNNQNVIDGNAKKIMARLQPKNTDKTPKIKVPTIDPKLEIDPSHDTSSFEISPSTSGVSSDNRMSNAGENQPEILPCPTNTKLAGNRQQNY